MEAKEPTRSSSTFSDEPLLNNYFDRKWIVESLSAAGVELSSGSTHDYPVTDGSTTTDVFLEFRKPSRSVGAGD